MKRAHAQRGFADGRYSLPSWRPGRNLLPDHRVITRTGHPPRPSWWASPITIEGISCGGGGAERFWLPGNRKRVRTSSLAVTKQELLTGSGIPLRSKRPLFLQQDDMLAWRGAAAWICAEIRGSRGSRSGERGWKSVRHLRECTRIALDEGGFSLRPCRRRRVGRVLHSSGSPAFAVTGCTYAGTHGHHHHRLGGDSAIIGIDATATPDDIVFDNDTALVRRHRVVM